MGDYFWTSYRRLPNIENIKLLLVVLVAVVALILTFGLRIDEYYFHIISRIQICNRKHIIRFKVKKLMMTSDIIGRAVVPKLHLVNAAEIFRKKQSETPNTSNKEFQSRWMIFFVFVLYTFFLIFFMGNLFHIIIFRIFFQI